MRTQVGMLVCYLLLAAAAAAPAPAAGGSGVVDEPRMYAWDSTQGMSMCCLLLLLLLRLILLCWVGRDAPPPPHTHTQLPTSTAGKVRRSQMFNIYDALSSIQGYC